MKEQIEKLKKELEAKNLEVEIYKIILQFALQKDPEYRELLLNLVKQDLQNHLESLSMKGK